MTSYGIQGPANLSEEDSQKVMEARNVQMTQSTLGEERNMHKIKLDDVQRKLEMSIKRVDKLEESIKKVAELEESFKLLEEKCGSFLSGTKKKTSKKLTS